MSSIAANRRAVAALKRFVNTLPENPRGNGQWGGIDSDTLAAKVNASKLSAKGKAAVRTLYSASFPSGTEGRIDPQRADMLRVLASALNRLVQADEKGDGNQKVSKAELATTRGFTPKRIDAFAAEFER